MFKGGRGAICTGRRCKKNGKCRRVGMSKIHNKASRWVCRKTEPKFKFGRRGANACPSGYAKIKEKAVCARGAGLMKQKFRDDSNLFKGGNRSICTARLCKKGKKTCDVGMSEIHNSTSKWLCKKTRTNDALWGIAKNKAIRKMLKAKVKEIAKRRKQEKKSKKRYKKQQKKMKKKKKEEEKKKKRRRRRTMKRIRETRHVKW